MALAVAVSAVGALVVIGFVPPAHAVHLFPLTPTFDPVGHDCAKALTAAPAVPAATVQVVGFSFSDARSRNSTTTITAGQAVTWTWTLDHCHSVTFGDGRGTEGASGFMPAGQPQLVRMGGAGKDSFALTFAAPGTFDYSCVHHASVGMTGTVVVTAAEAQPAPSNGPSAPPPSQPDAAPGDTSSSSTAARPTLPVTGSVPLAAPVGALAVAAFALGLLVRRAAR